MFLNTRSGARAYMTGCSLNYKWQVRAGHSAGHNIHIHSSRMLCLQHIRTSAQPSRPNPSERTALRLMISTKIARSSAGVARSVVQRAWATVAHTRVTRTAANATTLTGPHGSTRAGGEHKPAMNTMSYLISHCGVASTNCVRGLAWRLIRLHRPFRKLNLPGHVVGNLPGNAS